MLLAFTYDVFKTVTDTDLATVGTNIIPWNPARAISTLGDINVKLRSVTSLRPGTLGAVTLKPRAGKSC